MFSARIINWLRTARISKHVLEIYLFNRRMPSIYHENCGKPGPKSNAYIPPPEERVFKSRSAPNSPSLGERKYLFARASPRLTRALIQVSDKMTAAKNPKSGKVGRSKSFHGKGTCVYMNCAGVTILCHPSFCIVLRRLDWSASIEKRVGSWYFRTCRQMCNHRA